MKSKNHRMWTLLFVMLCACAGAVRGDDLRVAMVIGPEAPPLEQLAAREIAASLKRLYGAQTTVATEIATAENVILLGSPKTNPAIPSAGWPALSEQGQVLKTIQKNGRAMLLVGGESPRGTLWAAFELGHQMGVRSLLQGDFVAVERRPFSLQGFDVVLEPAVATRAWQTLDGGVIGWEAWSYADQLRILKQLSKQRINRLIVNFGSDQPFVHFEVAGSAKTTGALFSGMQFRVDGDTAGRSAFKGARLFENPDFSGRETYESRREAGHALVTKLVDSAHELGMTVGVRLAPLQFPPELQATIGSGDQNSRFAAAAAHIDACLKQYPTVDALYLELPAHEDADEVALEKWRSQITSKSKETTRAVELHFVQQQPGQISKHEHAPTRGMNLVTAAVPGASNEGQFNLGFNASDITRTQVVLPLSNHSVGVLPQMTLESLRQPCEAIREARGAGWIITAQVPSDAELGAYYLSRFSFDPKITPRTAADELITTIAGTGVSERLLKGFEMVEKATQTVSLHSATFASPSPEIVAQHAKSSDPIPAWWTQVRDLYTGAMNEMYRGNTRAREGGRGFILYYARRYEFGLTYMTSLEAVRKSAVANSTKDVEATTASLEAAVEGMYNALGAYSEVARDPSDRGVIALLNEFGYRRLQKMVEEADSSN